MPSLFLFYVLVIYGGARSCYLFGYMVSIAPAPMSAPKRHSTSGDMINLRAGDYGMIMVRLRYDEGMLQAR